MSEKESKVSLQPVHFCSKGLNLKLPITTVTVDEDLKKTKLKMLTTRHNNFDRFKEP